MNQQSPLCIHNISYVVKLLIIEHKIWNELMGSYDLVGVSF